MYMYVQNKYLHNYVHIVVIFVACFVTGCQGNYSEHDKQNWTPELRRLLNFDQTQALQVDNGEGGREEGREGEGGRRGERGREGGRREGGGGGRRGERGEGGREGREREGFIHSVLTCQVCFGSTGSHCKHSMMSFMSTGSQNCSNTSPPFMSKSRPVAAA